MEAEQKEERRGEKSKAQKWMQQRQVLATTGSKLLGWATYFSWV